MLKYRIQIRGSNEVTQVYKSPDKDEYFYNEECTKPASIDDFIFLPYVPYELFGFEFNKGWNNIVKPVIEYVEAYNKNKLQDEQICFTQIKEKYGQLCIYTNFVTKELEELINKAEDEASHTCEYCGSKEDVGCTLYWNMTICHRCLKDMVNKEDRGRFWERCEDSKVYWVSPGNVEDEEIDEKELP